LTFRPGRRLRILARQPRSASGWPCAARAAGGESCGVVARVRAVVCRDGGPKRRCWWSAGCGRAVGCRGGGPEALAVLRALSLSRADDEAAFDAGHRGRFDAALRRVGFFIYARASRACSSHSSNGVFSSAMVEGQLVSANGVLSLGCSVILGGLGPVVGGRCPVLFLLYGFRPVFPS
jgi:hypothetical protein